MGNQCCNVLEEEGNITEDRRFSIEPAMNDTKEKLQIEDPDTHFPKSEGILKVDKMNRIS